LAQPEAILGERLGMIRASSMFVIFADLKSTYLDYKVRELIAVKVLHTSLLNTIVVAFQVPPWEGMHRCQRLVHPSKQFWSWFCGMAFRAALVLLLMSSMSSKCLPFNIFFIFENRKKSLGARSGE